MPKKFHYFSILKIVFKTWFQCPCFCKKNIQMDVFQTLHGLLSSWWPNQVIIWYFKPKKVLNIFRNYMFCGNLFKSTNLQYHKKNHTRKLIHRVGRALFLTLSNAYEELCIKNRFISNQLKMKAGMKVVTIRTVMVDVANLMPALTFSFNCLIMNHMNTEQRKC